MFVKNNTNFRYPYRLLSVFLILTILGFITGSFFVPLVGMIWAALIGWGSTLIWFALLMGINLLFVDD